MIGPITGSVAENEGFSTWSQTRGYLRYRSPLAEVVALVGFLDRGRVPRDRVLMGSSGFAFDDQAMIAHVTSPFTDKIAPYRSNPHPPILASSLSPLPLAFRPFPPSRHLSPGSRLVSAREHVAIAQPPGNSITVDHLDHELTPYRARGRFTSASISLVYIYIRMYMYNIYTRGQGLLRLSSETSDRSFPADWDSENYDAVPRSSLKISLRNPIVKIGEKCRD